MEETIHSKKLCHDVKLSKRETRRMKKSNSNIVPLMPGMNDVHNKIFIVIKLLYPVGIASGM